MPESAARAFVPDWLARRAELSPEKTALIDTLQDNRPLSYASWNRQVNQTARLLQADLGVAPGDRVAVLSKNCVAYLDLWFSMPKLGAVLQNLNWRLAGPELSALLQGAEPAVLAYDPALPEPVEALRSALPGRTRFLSLGEPLAVEDRPLQARDGLPFAPLPPPPLSPEDPWLLCYTGGTTGVAKGALLSYRSVTANAVNTIISWGLTPEDTTLLNAPLFHTGGLNVLTAPLVYLGGTSIVCREFEVDQTLEYLGRGAITVYFGVPTMFVMMQNHPRWPEVRFDSLRFIISGGAPCPQPVFERFWAKGVDFKSGYGLTEAGPNTFWLPAEQVRSKPGAVGYPLFHVRLRVVDAHGAEVPPGEVGELLIRGPHLFSGYWRQEEATREALRDGWLHTGDLACCDEDGCYTIMGRSKEMILSGGENVYPSEVENVLHAHPGVAEAALIAVPDELWGEVGWAVVVPRPGQEVSEEAVRAFCRERLAGYKIPKRVVFTPELPKTGANKVDKGKLLELYGPG